MSRKKNRNFGHDNTGVSANVNLASVDLNLLVALEALLQVRNVTHAGKRIGLSQPAMSRALSRLRALFKDDLLVKTARGLTLTLRGEQLLANLPEAMDLLRALVSGRDATQPYLRKISIALSEHQLVVLLPELLPRLLNRDPDLDVVLRNDLSGALRGLEEGTIDFAVGQLSNSPSGFYTRTLYTDKLACILRQGHPVLKQQWTREIFLELRHAILAGSIDLDPQAISDGICNQQLWDSAPLPVACLTAAPLMVAQTDLVLVLPYRAAMRVASSSSLTVKDLPDNFAASEIALIWHERSHRDPRHRWMRAEFAAAAAAVQR